MNVIAYLSNTWWGLHLQSLKTLYYVLLKNMMEYGAQVFSFAGNRILIAKLQRLQNKALRIAYGYKNSTNILLVV